MIKLPRDFEIEKYGLRIRLATEEDAEFIHNLRTDPKNSPFMHVDGCTVDTQRQWLKEYKKREDRGEDYYFIYYFEGKPIGVDRLYHIKEKEFHCGSWVFKFGLPAFCSLAGAVLAREIAFEILEKEVESNIEDGIVSTNVHVISFMTMLGFKRTGEHLEGNFHFINGLLSKEDFNKNKAKVIRFLPKEFQ